MTANSKSQKFFNKDWKEIKRTPCMVYSRVMWFIRPVQYYNTGKKSEFYSRTYFQENSVLRNDWDWECCGNCNCKSWFIQRAKTIKQTV